MDRTLRALIVAVVVLIITGTSFLMGFGAAVLLTGLPGTPAAAADVATPVPAAVPAPTAPGPAQAAPPGATATPTTPSSSRTLINDVQARFGLFWEALRHVNDNFFDQQAIDAQKIVYGAISGMVETLGDPNTYFAPPQQVKSNRETLEGAFEGIGATIEKKDDKLLIVAPIAGTPAQRAGLRAGDWIIKIDGKDTAPLNVNEAVSMIRGKKGTAVVLTIVREGTKDPFDVSIVRDVINVPSVSFKMVEGNFAHIQLVNVFGADTTAQLRSALQQARQQGAKGIILDLRNNPGGYLQTAIEVSSQFLKDGVVAYELLRSGRRTELPVQRGGIATDLPLVVLVNKGSASASEIVAGAIQDAGRGVIIGELTFGKASVQQDFNLSDGSAVHVTIANWLTPKGKNISKQGITPDIEVKLTEEDVKANRDPQLQRAIEYLRTGK